MPHLRQDEHDNDRTMKVVDHIRALIEQGTLQPGDQLPPERELAQTLKISRASLRTGLGYLTAMGVMKVRHGVGTFISDGPAKFSKASMSLMGALHGFQFWQMFEARVIMEGNLAALAAERGKPEHHAALAEEVAEMYAVAAQASGNPILAALIDTVTSAMYEQRKETVQRADYLREMAEMHREIFRAIHTRNPVEARKLMENHLRRAESAQNMEIPSPVEKRSAPKRTPNLPAPAAHDSAE